LRKVRMTAGAEEPKPTSRVCWILRAVVMNPVDSVLTQVLTRSGCQSYHNERRYEMLTVCNGCERELVFAPPGPGNGSRPSLSGTVTERDR
jgi:hypothetical protein